MAKRGPAFPHLGPADVSAVVVTRGDVPLAPILVSFAAVGWRQILVWDNSLSADLGAFGRYEAIRRDVTADVVYVQDDDCVVPPATQRALLDLYEDGVMLSNMDPAHNGSAMPYLALPGWGALFRRDLPDLAFARWYDSHPDDWLLSDDFLRVGCDIVFPVLTPSRMVDLGHENLPYAWDAHRTNLRPGYHEKKARYYAEAVKIRESF